MTVRYDPADQASPATVHIEGRDTGQFKVGLVVALLLVALGSPASSARRSWADPPSTAEGPAGLVLVDLH